ncbi:hypothetical protein Tco_1137247, partial [Tanacetum coccineum]
FVLVFVEAAKQSGIGGLLVVSVTVSLLWIVDSERDRLIVIVVCPAMLCFTYHSDFQSELLACLKPMTLTNIMLTFKHHFQNSLYRRHCVVMISFLVMPRVSALAGVTEEAEAMAETMEQYMSKTRTDYGSGVARPKIEEKDSFELKGQFLKEL